MIRKTLVTLAGVAIGSALIATDASATQRHRHSYVPARPGLMMSAPPSWGPAYEGSSPGQNCKSYGSISHRCLSFSSDSIWPHGLSNYHGSN